MKLQFGTMHTIEILEFWLIPLKQQIKLVLIVSIFFKSLRPDNRSIASCKMPNLITLIVLNFRLAETQLGDLREKSFKEFLCSTS